MKSSFHSFQEREDSLKYWEERFTTDTVDINARLAAKREQLRVANARREELQKLVGRRTLILCSG